MFLSDYKNGSIVNLTSSILKAFGASSDYTPLKELDGLDSAQNVVLLVIDGLGYEYLKKYGQGSIFEKYLVKKLTSVFPAGTPSALMTLQTGVAPDQHGITGWHVYLKELGVVSTILPFEARCGGGSFVNCGIEKKDIFTEKTIGEKIDNPYYIVYPDKIVLRDRDERKNILPFDTLDNMFLRMEEAVRSENVKKYIYAYWPKFDSLCHIAGTDSTEVKNHFEELDKKVSAFAESIRGTNTVLVITADHGLIDTPKSNVIFLENHPLLNETLTLPLCGQTRSAYCYVRPSKAKQFENYINQELSYCCEWRKSEELIKENYFGLYGSNKKLFDRVGDYVVLMKENYIIKDRLMKEKIDVFIGNHGGVSKEEMFVPLIAINLP